MTDLKYKTLVIDSGGELARLTFSFDMKKHAGDFFKESKEKIRMPNNYPGATERMNMIFRRLKNCRAVGMEVYITAHEDVEKLYLKGGEIAQKGQPQQEPYALKGWADLPGKRAPEELGRAVDNQLRVRLVNKEFSWIAIPESIGPGCVWCVKDRFNAPMINGGYLPASYEKIAELALKTPGCNWKPPYIWLIYGAIGSKKTRSIITFPGPIRVLDLDQGTTVLTDAEVAAKQINITKYDPEESDDYNRFLGDLEACMP